MTITSLREKAFAYLDDYQHDSCHALIDHQGFGLYDDMGVGKTPPTAVALGEVSSYSAKYTSLIVSWQVVKPWWASCIEDLTGLPTNLITTKNPTVRPGVNIIHWQLVARMVSELSRPWHVVILDESRAIKNRKSGIGRAIHKVRGEFNWCLDGSPTPNHPAVEIWNQLKWMHPKEYRGFWDFLEKYCNIGRDQWGHYTIDDMDDASCDRLWNDIQWTVMRRMKSKTLKLPPKERIPIRFELSKSERKAYENLILNKVSEWDDKLIFAWNQAAANTITRQLLSGGRGGESTRLKTARQLINPLVAENHSVLVFSNFVDPLKRLISGRKEQQLLAGDSRGNAEKIEAFQKGDLHVLASTLKLGGAGLNLQDCCCKGIMLDMDYVPANMLQGEDRLDRRGQKYPVSWYYLLADDTIDMGIYEAVEVKQKAVSKTWCQEHIKFLKKPSKGLDKIKII